MTWLDRGMETFLEMRDMLGITDRELAIPPFLLSSKHFNSQNSEIF